MKRLIGLLLLLLLTPACGMTFTQKLKTANDMTHDVMKQANPGLQLLCNKELDNCATKGMDKAKLCQPGTVKEKCLEALAEACPKFKTLYTMQKHLNKLAAGIHIGVVTAAAAKTAGDADGAKAIAEQVYKGLLELKTAVMSSGLLGDLMKLTGAGGVK